jgi:hypothetical protein
MHDKPQRHATNDNEVSIMQTMHKNNPEATAKQGDSRLCCTDCPPLESRIALAEASLTVFPCGPCLAATSKSGEVSNSADDLGWVLEELHTKATRDMERNVAMHQPSARVISWEGNDEISTGISSVRITTDRVGEVECCSCTSSIASCNDPLRNMLAFDSLV